MESVKSKKTLSFESSLEKLEKIVETLESGDVKLEELVNKFEEGLMYQKICQEHIDRAELIINSKDQNSNIL